MKFESKMQVLITGCYRSGTEYLSLLLNNHPELSSTMYTVSFMRFCYNRYNPINQKENYTKLILEAADRINNRWGKDIHVDESLSKCYQTNNVTYALLYDLMMCNLFLDESVRKWAEKVQLVWTKIPAFLNMFPNGKVIHVIRDPRSVLASFKQCTYAPDPAYLGAIFNCFDSMTKGLLFNNQLDKNQYTLIKFEDLLKSTEEKLVELFNFLCLSSKHDLLSQKDWQNEFGKPWHHNTAFINKNQKITKFDKNSALYRWVDNLKDWETAFCEHINFKPMQKLGYPLSSIQADWDVIDRILFNDQVLKNYYKKWIDKDEGVEEFPTDPLDPRNWTENVLSNKE